LLRHLLLLSTILTILGLMLTLNPSNANAATPARLQLLSLHCFETEDVRGADEAYIMLDGTRVWAGSINNGQDRDLTRIPIYSFFGAASFELWDDDGNKWYDRNDFLGQWTAYSWEKDSPVQKAYFILDDASYVLYYRVLSPNRPSRSGQAM
jgi:hypothetical protein